MANYWLVRAGEGGVYARDFVDGGFIAVRFFLTMDLSNIAHDEDIRAILTKKISEECPTLSPGKVAHGAGSLMRFIQGIKQGDKVITVDSKAGMIHVGTALDNECHFGALPGRKCPYGDWRKVEWTRSLRWVDLSEELRRALSLPPTLIELGDISSLMAEEK